MSVSLAALATAAAGIAEHQAACAGKNGWSDPAPPIRIFGNTFDVGTCGITVMLVQGPRGHVLIDGATAEAAPQILRNIRRLGLRPRDVRLILASHEHVDHVGGLAALQRATGAAIRLSPAATAVLRRGAVAADDPQLGVIAAPPAARTGPPVKDGETLRVGPLRLTAHFTPGHVAGGTSWTWRACAAKRCHAIAYADSLSAVSRDGFRFADHPRRVAALRASFTTVAALPCDLLITPHPDASHLYERLAGSALLVDRGACAVLAKGAAAALDKRLADEAAKR